MEKEFYSINDLMQIVMEKNLRVGHVYYFRSDNLIANYGIMLEIEFEIMQILKDSMYVSTKKYWFGANVEYSNASYGGYLIRKEDYHNIHRKPKFC